MSNRTAANVLIVLVVVAIVAGVAWFKMRRAEPLPAPSVPVAATSPQTATADEARPAGLAAATTAPVTTQEVATTAPATTQEVATTNPAEAKLPRLVDLGADKCIPCKKMAPILKELRAEYAGRAIVDFIDVWKNPAPGREYGIRVIPTQIFFDRDGKEVWRHEGFLSKEAIIAKFKELGVE